MHTIIHSHPWNIQAYWKNEKENILKLYYGLYLGKMAVCTPKSLMIRRDQNWIPNLYALSAGKYNLSKNTKGIYQKCIIWSITRLKIALETFHYMNNQYFVTKYPGWTYLFFQEFRSIHVTIGIWQMHWIGCDPSLLLESTIHIQDRIKKKFISTMECDKWNRDWTIIVISQGNGNLPVECKIDIKILPG